MEYGELMSQVMLDIFPEGYPTDDDILKMSIEEKTQLYMRQKELISRFREKADEQILSLQQQIQSIPTAQSHGNISLNRESKSVEIIQNVNKETIVEPPKTQHLPSRRNVSFQQSKLPQIDVKKRNLQKQNVQPPPTQSKIRKPAYTKPPFHI